MTHKQTQRNKVLQLLKNNPHGVNSHDLTYIHSVKQAPTRIKELKELGYSIISKPNYTRRSPSVDYVLQGEPEQQKPFRWVFEGNVARREYI